MSEKQKELLRWLYDTGQVEVRLPVRGGGPRLVLCRRYKGSVYSADVVRDVYEVARLHGMEVDE